MEPILFRIGSYTLHSYGTITLLGILLAAPGIWWDVGQRGMGGKSDRFSFVADFYLIGIAGGIVGGRALHVLTNLDQFLASPASIFALESTGYVFYGALMVVALGLWWLARKYRVAFGSVSDVFMTWLPLGHAFGRVGCFLAGCCHGPPTDGAIGVSFPPESIAYHSPFVAHLPDGSGTVPLHPAQLYEAVVLAGLFVWMVATRVRRGIQAPWVLTARYAVGYGLARFVLEVWRGDPERRYLFELPAGDLGPRLGLPLDHPLLLSTSQAIGLAAALGGIWLLSRLGRAPGEPTPRAKPGGTPPPA